jgi:S1-C subfamily serine protease
MDQRRPVRWLVAGLVGVALLSGLVGGLVGGFVSRLGSDGEEVATAEPTVEVHQAVGVQDGSAVTKAVTRAIPAVVTVVSEQHPREDALGRVVEEVAVGSGVIIDSRGYAVTNEHVVQDAVRLTVVLHDGQEREASLVGEDSPFTDVAVLKIVEGSEEFEAIPFGDSDALTLGETVVAVGTALLEFESTVTVGVVSGLHRRWSRNGVVMEDLVQTDAAINHGNSGGALLNTRGELVGLNTTVIRSTEEGQAVEGVAFAISSNTVAPVVRTIIEEGSYPRAFLGVTHRDLTPEMTLIGGLPVDHGALVTGVSAGTPAEEAEVQTGDIIVRMGDRALDEEHPFINVLGQLEPGQVVPFVIYRDGTRLTVEVTMGLR